WWSSPGLSRCSGCSGGSCTRPWPRAAHTLTP
ncbi:MAG: hypothetical protein AVDCRST_MAG60-1861, partial [uncultured Nocardioides sp.]